MKHLTLLSVTVFAATTSLIIGTAQSASALLWNWNYSGTGISASGTFTTANLADADGFYEITGITGTRNGETITGLQPTGTAIPGNEPFDVDNLIRRTSPQLSVHGFGYSTSGGNFVNPFFADFLTPSVYLEYFSAPPFDPGLGLEDSEEPIRFSAILVPEPNLTISLLAIGGTALIFKRGQKPSRSSDKEREKVG